MTDIHIVEGDLEMLAASVAEVSSSLKDLDVAGAGGRIGSAMPGSVSSGLTGAVLAALDERRISLGGRYGTTGTAARDSARAHQSNDAAAGRPSEAEAVSGAWGKRMRARLRVERWQPGRMCAAGTTRP